MDLAARAGALAAVAAAVLVLALPASARVFHAREELFELAFPNADTVTARDFFLTAEQRARIEGLARAELDSDLLTVYVGTRGGQVLGYAILDTHMVRTLPETFLIVVAADGSVAATHVVAFYEPLEYLPSDRWLDQLDGRVLSSDLRVGRAIAGITGSTLSSRAVLGGIRRALAVYEVLLTGAR